jgi:protein-S-isoprenylcysteine O-methyltransferase Ste14
MSNHQLSPSQLTAKALARVVAEFLIQLALLLLSAGTVAYWQAWTLMGLYLVAGTLVQIYLAANPELLERRSKSKEKDPRQGLIRKVGFLFHLTAYVVPGLDFRFKWSHVPVALVLLADVVVLLTFVWYILVVRENSFASRVIEVVQGQRVVRTGPYAIVRHPMYLGSIIFFFVTPIALGSWWAMITALPLAAALVARIRNEERLLSKELEGYLEYAQITKYRLIPCVW